jgi:hypothetical protein
MIFLNFLPINTPVVKVEPGNICQNEHDHRQEKQDENTEDGIGSYSSIPTSSTGDKGSFRFVKRKSTHKDSRTLKAGLAYYILCFWKPENNNTESFSRDLCEGITQPQLVECVEL